MDQLPARLIALLSTLIIVSGCASTGDGISDAAHSGDPAAMARDGAKLNSQGKELVKDGESLLIDGRKQVRDGEAMVSNGSSLVTNARFEYKDVAQASGNANTPKAVDAEAKRLRAIGDRWEKAIDTIRDGNELVEKGNKNIEKAQADIRKGRQMMERGSALVRNSERIRFNEALLPVPN
jgi:hypothetical protein